MKKRPRLIKFFRGTVVAIVGLVTLVFLIVAIENWRAKRAWESYREEAAAHGERLSFAAFVPPPVPNEENFLMTPLMRPVFEEKGVEYAGELSERFDLQSQERSGARPDTGSWGTGSAASLEEWRDFTGEDDLVAALARREAAMAEFAEAVRRPSSRAPLPYERGDLFSLGVPHTVVLTRASDCFFLRGLVALEERDHGGAVADIETLLLLAESQTKNPFLVMHLVASHPLRQGLQLVWEGQRAHQFSDAQLARLQGHLERLAPLAGGARAVKAERAAMTEYFESLLAEEWVYVPTFGIPVKLSDLDEFGHSPSWVWTMTSKLAPRSVVYRNLLSLNQWHDRVFREGIEVDKHRVLPERIDRTAEALREAAEQRSIYNMSARSQLPTFTNVVRRMVVLQAECDLAVLSCSLERYRVAHGDYPATLEQLVPRYAAELPHDLFTGKPLTFRRNEDGGYILYAVGWNAADDGGTAMDRDGWRAEDLVGEDVVWTIPGAP